MSAAICDVGKMDQRSEALVRVIRGSVVAQLSLSRYNGKGREGLT